MRVVYGLLAMHFSIPQRVQVPNNHILTQNLYYTPYYPTRKYLIIGYLDLLGSLPTTSTLLDCRFRFRLEAFEL